MNIHIIYKYVIYLCVARTPPLHTLNTRIHIYIFMTTLQICVSLF